MAKNIKKPLNHFIFPNITTRNLAPIKLTEISESYEKKIELISKKFDNYSELPNTSKLKRRNVKKKLTSKALKTYNTINKATKTTETSPDYTSTKETFDFKDIKQKLILEELNISTESVGRNEVNTLFPTELKNYKMHIPKVNLHDLYNSFNDILGHHQLLNFKADKTVREINRSLYHHKNKEKFEQNDIIGGIQRVKIFDMEEKEKRVFGREINKNVVMNEYNIINNIKHDYADLLYNKYVDKKKFDANLTKEKFKINHKKIMDMLDEIKYRSKN
jgi:hypothetical protein